MITEERKDRKKKPNDEEHLAAARCESDIGYPFPSLPDPYSVYRPNLKTKSDADILRDAKLEAMGMSRDEHEYRRPQHERTQMATDELVCITFFSAGTYSTLCRSWNVLRKGCGNNLVSLYSYRLAVVMYLYFCINSA